MQPNSPSIQKRVIQRQIEFLVILFHDFVHPPVLAVDLGEVVRPRPDVGEGPSRVVPSRIMELFPKLTKRDI